MTVIQTLWEGRMDQVEAPADAASAKARRGRKRVTEIEVLGLVSLALTIAVDVLTRFVLEDQPAFRVATFLSVVAMSCAIFDAVATARAFRRHPHAFKLHLVADVTAAALLVLTTSLRFVYWDNHLGTPIRAILPAVLAFLLISVATWANVTDHSDEQAEPDDSSVVELTTAAADLQEGDDAKDGGGEEEDRAEVVDHGAPAG